MILCFTPNDQVTDYRLNNDLYLKIFRKMSKKPRIALYLHKAQKYRIPIFRILALKYEVTVYCENYEEFKNEECLEFKKITLKKIGPFIVHNFSALKDALNYDVIIGLLNIRCIDLIALTLIPFRRYKTIYWGIGVAASYHKKYDEPDNLQFIRYLIAKIADSVIFYSEYPIKKYVDNKVSKNKIFVANNTIDTSFSINQTQKYARDKLLFIGTLYKEKGLHELLESYLSAYKIINSELKDLIIIGDGELKNELINYTIENNIIHKVKFMGAIYDDDILNSIYSQTIACISPNQAGLSVLSSMSRMVPFVTSKNAITGGEIFNINSLKNGIIYESPSELCPILISASLQPDMFLEMGKNALEFYIKKRSPSAMAQGISDAIDFSLNG